jgi:hypothetical protein
VTQFLPIDLGTPGGTDTVVVSTAAQAVDVFNFSLCSDPGNGFNQLYAQLLGAKLNIANGADGTAVATDIAEADLILATNNCASWAGFTTAQRAVINNLASDFDSYNSGTTGPGHCPGLSSPASSRDGRRGDFVRR